MSIMSVWKIGHFFCFLSQSKQSQEVIYAATAAETTTFGFPSQTILHATQNQVFLLSINGQETDPKHR